MHLFRITLYHFIFQRILFIFIQRVKRVFYRVPETLKESCELERRIITFKPFFRRGDLLVLR